MGAIVSQSKEQRRLYRQSHRKEIAEYQKEWFQNHPEFYKQYEDSPQRKAYQAAWRTSHHEERLQQGKEWRASNRERTKITSRTWYLQHFERKQRYEKERYLRDRERILEVGKLWRKTPNGKRASSKTKAERRNLGFIALNQWFIGSHAHHIDRERVIYIPSGLHQSIKHSVIRGRNMDRINKVAFEYLSSASK